jgi:hypothetical protein
LKCPRRFRELRDVLSELLKRRDFPVTDFIPVPLVNSKQFEEQDYRVILWQSMCFAPIGNGTAEFLIEVYLFIVGHRDHLAVTSKSVADSISA